MREKHFTKTKILRSRLPSRLISLTSIVFSAIFITVNVIIEVIPIRENIKGGALTETTLLVLLSTYEPRHGYGIMKFIEEQTKGRVALGAGTLYGAINTLVKKSWISPLDTEKKEYLITNTGKQHVKTELKRLKELERLAAGIIGGAG